MQEANAAIEENRGRNQAASFFGAFLLLPYLASETNATERDEVNRLYERRDVLNRMSATKGCG